MMGGNELFIPWLGVYISSQILKNLQFSYAGESNNTGFRITTRQKGILKIWKTEGYRHEGLAEDISANKELLIMFLALLLWLAVPAVVIGYMLMIIVGAAGFPLAFLDSLGYCLAIFSPLYLFIVGAMSLKSKKFLEYHSCEHKLAVILNAGLDPTEENFHRAPKNIVTCGSSFFSFVFFTFALAGLALSTHNSILLTIAAAGIAGSILVVMVGRITIFLEGKLRKDLLKKLLCYGLLIPLNILLMSILTASIVPILFEYLFCVRNPRTSIIEEGLELAMQIQQTK